MTSLQQQQDLLRTLSPRWLDDHTADDPSNLHPHPSRFELGLSSLRWKAIRILARKVKPTQRQGILHVACTLAGSIRQQSLHSGSDRRTGAGKQRLCRGSKTESERYSLRSWPAVPVLTPRIAAFGAYLEPIPSSFGDSGSSRILNTPPHLAISLHHLFAPAPSFGDKAIPVLLNPFPHSAIWTGGTNWQIRIIYLKRAPSFSDPGLTRLLVWRFRFITFAEPALSIGNPSGTHILNAPPHLAIPVDHVSETPPPPPPPFGNPD